MGDLFMISLYVVVLTLTLFGGIGVIYAARVIFITKSLRLLFYHVGMFCIPLGQLIFVYYGVVWTFRGFKGYFPVVGIE